MKMMRMNGNKKRLALSILCGCSLVLGCVFVAFAGNESPTTQKKIVKTQQVPSKAKATKHKSAISRKEVKTLQKALNRKGFHLKIDGIIGKHTRAAIKVFQKRNGLKVTGKPDRLTLAKLGVK